MSFVDPKIVLNIFEDINKVGVDYVLLRNIGQELPNKLEKNKDIDLLVRYEDRKKFKNSLLADGWQKCWHPHDNGSNFIFLYSMQPFEMYKKDDVHLDVCYQLNCRSTNGEWMPLDEHLQENLWKERIIDENLSVPKLGNTYQLVHLLTRSVFDKKEFTQPYIIEIEKLIEKVDLKELSDLLEPVFFKYSPRLVERIKTQNYEGIFTDFISFSSY